MFFSSPAKFILLSIGLFLFSTNTQALDHYYVGGIGFENGGDAVLYASYTDGTSDTLHLGHGVNLFFGAEAALNSNKTVFGSVTLGLKYSAISPAIDANASILRYPLEALLYYRVGRHRFGAGATYHLAIDYDTGGKAASADIKLESNIGMILEYGLSVDEESNTFIGIRYTDLTYHLPDYDVDLDAGSTGIYLKVGF